MYADYCLKLETGHRIHCQPVAGVQYLAQHSWICPEDLILAAIPKLLCLTVLWTEIGIRRSSVNVDLTVWYFPPCTIAWLMAAYRRERGRKPADAFLMQGAVFSLLGSSNRTLILVLLLASGGFDQRCRCRSSISRRSEFAVAGVAGMDMSC